MEAAGESEITILDHIENISVAGHPFREPSNEYWALICLRDGMEFLYKQALACDHAVKSRVNPDGKVQYFGMGNDPAFAGIPKALLTCAFHWYAISACQYALTIGAIAKKFDESREDPKAYAKKVIPEVFTFRDKIAAHFAWHTPKDKRDNDAERLASILPPLTFLDDSFHVAGFAVSQWSGGTESNSAAIRPWSLCRVHEGLTKRYWPRREA